MSGDSRCAGLEAAENQDCKEVVEWAAEKGKWDPNANEWYSDMQKITGKSHLEANLADFQRLYFCSPPGGKSCGLPPCNCGKPPCNSCFGGGGGDGGSSGAARVRRPGCDGNSKSIECVPPKRPFGYKGRAWKPMTVSGKGDMHIFAIGDWGGMDGSLNPIEGRIPVVAYDWGKRPGPSVFPRTRWDKQHYLRMCSHKEFVECFNTRGSSCVEGCGYTEGVDDQPQQLVAAALRTRAAEKDPAYILNVGDNFYWGGIEKNCGTPMDEISFTAHHQFNQIFESIYQGAGLSKKPWLSVLGNHDWGGRVFNNGWDQQIAYTWASDRWVMPAPYWSQYVEYPDLGFDVDIYFIDSNFVDAKEPSEDPEHNICGAKHNPEDANCSVADGPASVESCPQYFRELWAEQQRWLEKEISKSKASWQLLVTHFPCGHAQDWYKQLRQQFGLDLLITGHRHDQELWLPDDTAKNHMGGLTCIVTGGGGGITSEATPNPENTTDWYGEGQYGFYDLTISKQSILIQSINWNGSLILNHTVYPH